MLLTLLSTHFERIFATHQEVNPSIDEILPRIQEIFEVRTDIWNNLLDESADKNLTKVQLKLRDYVEDPLLREDLKTFQEMIENPTSFEKVLSFRIDECSILETFNGITKVLLNIYWELEGYDGISNESVNYFVELTKENQKWYIRDYRVALKY